MNEILTLAGLDSAQLTATAAARAKRDALIDLARGVATVSDQDSAKRAAMALVDVKSFTRSIEDARAEVKGPVVELGKRIDNLARELTTDLETAATRLSRVIGAYQSEQKRIADEARAKALAEELRIWEEAQAVERAKAEEARKLAAEEKRKADAAAAELAAKAARARSEAGRVKALEEAERLRFRAQMDADEATRKAEAESAQRLEAAGKRMVAERIEAASIVAVKPAGVATREEICFEVESLTALHEAAPYLVILSPNNAAIKNALKHMSAGQTLPGVRHWKESKTFAR